MVKKIPLQNGMVALVDDEDFDRVNQYVWTVNTTIAKTNLVVRNRILNTVLQKFILGNDASDDGFITFKNKNDLDFRRSNLIVTDRKGVSIRKKGNKNASSKYKGVSWCKRSKRWLAQIQTKGKHIHLGYFDLEEEAAEKYNKASLEIFGEQAYQNLIGNYNGSEEVDLKQAKKHRRINGNTSKFRGVSLNSKMNRYVSSTTFKGEYFYLGTFSNEIEAAKVYDKKAIELHGEKAVLNFPELINEYIQQNKEGVLS